MNGSVALRDVRRWPGRARDGLRVAGHLCGRMARAAMRDRVHGLAAEASFWTMLSLPPLLLALLTLIGELGAVFGTDMATPVANAVVDWADGVFTHRTMHDVVRPLVTTTLREGGAGVLTLSLVLALWSGSAAVNAYISAITLAYDMDGLRSFWRTRLLSLAVYLSSLVIGAVLLPLLVLGPVTAGDLLAGVAGGHLTWLVTAGYWPLVTVLALVGLTSLYHVAVPVRTRWRRDLPGAVVAMLLWLGGSAGLRFYLASGGGGHAGAAAAPIAVLIFFFITALAVLIGAELNASIDDFRPDASTATGRRQARERRREQDRSGAGGPRPAQAET
ncbi:YihY/virulence factor BrkB family protein [Nucisporomicrobium flavum]|uniref:YihY/virulence factor BrkB family protein n=1 Tax=Nucisporomicrobium flavum TaxID=2785915 RepID=UPI0018F43F1C|nr:YihY/virulence factor BrkB family protein [Nucisporomicrobium flavum]